MKDSKGIKSTKDFPLRSPGLATIQAKLLIDFAQRKGIPVQQCIRDTGINLVQLEDNDKEISPEQEIKIIDNILNRTKECPFGLGYEYGFENNLRSMGVIGHSILSSATLKQSIKVASRYYPNAFHWVKYHVEYTDQYYKVFFKVEESISKAAQYFVLARDIGIIAAIHYDVFDKRKDCIELFSLALPHLPGVEKLEEHFNARLMFDQKLSYFTAPAVNLLSEMPFANKQTSILLEQQCQQYLTTDRTSADLIQTIQQLLSHKTGEVASKSEIAALLNISARTLGRKLAELDTSWTEVITQHKLNKAMALIKSTELEIKEIAKIVGYSSSSVLSRKLIDKVGLSAGEYRKRLKSRPH